MQWIKVVLQEDQEKVNIISQGETGRKWTQADGSHNGVGAGTPWGYCLSCGVQPRGSNSDYGSSLERFDLRIRRLLLAVMSHL